MSARVSFKAVELARKKGIKAGLFRPKTLFPFPINELQHLSNQADKMLVVEMNAGQMVEDVRLAVNGNISVEFYGRMGGVIPSPNEILNNIINLSELKE